MKIEKINIEDEDYPDSLRSIKNPPKKLYLIGNKKLLKTKGIAIVGSRNCTKEGSENSKIFAANLAKAGFTIVSGMAKGIDGASHIRCNGSKGKNNCSFG